jgi:hypothetical protein
MINIDGVQLTNRIYGKLIVARIQARRARRLCNEASIRLREATIV